MMKTLNKQLSTTLKSSTQSSLLLKARFYLLLRIKYTKKRKTQSVTAQYAEDKQMDSIGPISHIQNSLDQRNQNLAESLKNIINHWVLIPIFVIPHWKQSL